MKTHSKGGLLGSQGTPEPGTPDRPGIQDALELAIKIVFQSPR